MTEETKRTEANAANQAQPEEQLSDEQLEKASAGLDIGSSTLTSDDATEAQTDSRAGFGVLKTTDGGTTW